MLLTAIVGGLSTTWLLHRARAAVDERLGAVGTELLSYARSRHVGDAQRVQVNGLSFVLQVGTSEDGVRDVVAHFARRCHTGHAAWDAATRQHASDTQGYVACIDTQGDVHDVATLRARMTEFARELDIAAFGTLTYVTAERTNGLTTYVVVRSTGPAPLTKAFPQTTDAPGFDPSWVPRPSGTLRVLSATTDGSGPSLHVFRAQSSDAPHELRNYARSLNAAGFALEHGDGRRLRGRHHMGEILLAVRTQPDGTTYFALVASPRATASTPRR